MNIFGCALQYFYIKFMLKVTKAWETIKNYNKKYLKPSWLSSQCLPDQRELPNELSESVEKERKQKQARACVAIAKEPVIDPCRSERWLTLVPVAAYVLRGESKRSSGSKELSVEKLQDAKLYWYRQIKWKVYQAEYERPKENLLLPNTSAILKLDPYYAREIGCYR